MACLCEGTPFVAHEQAAPSIAASVLSLVDVDRTVLDVAGYPPPEGGEGVGGGKQDTDPDDSDGGGWACRDEYK